MSHVQNNFYKPEEAIFHNDGREERLLEYIRAHPDYSKMQGSPERILAAIDEYGRSTDFLMNVGTEKGIIVAEDLIPKFEPDLMVELGGYVGYSTILFGAALKKFNGRKYLSLEASPKFAAISGALVELAGLDDVVEIRVGPCRDSLRKLRQEYPTGVVDVFFIDHAKLEYVNDLKLCEELGLVGPGTTVIADNVISPGVPDYLKYVQSSTKEKIAKVQDEKKSPIPEATDKSLGNPYLVYENTLINSFEPTGEPDSLEVSQCVCIESL
ncbi:catechol O-methyltransferase 1 [Penicillium brevicompactum]|uniref:catechol O-methyltransferase n=1 Tax=Penicillium brevicompactum TaxID=5074 RepID=A0A9W9UUJ5_PENBR|nr:catechol O-methyltransferase 1 [Penicillium brevicompactum]